MGGGDVAQRVVRMGVAGETQQDLLVVRRDFGLAAEIGGSPPSEVGAGGDQGRRERDVTLRVPMGHEVEIDELAGSDETTGDQMDPEAGQRTEEHKAALESLKRSS